MAGGKKPVPAALSPPPDLRPEPADADGPNGTAFPARRAPADDALSARHPPPGSAGHPYSYGQCPRASSLSRVKSPSRRF